MHCIASGNFGIQLGMAHFPIINSLRICWKGLKHDDVIQMMGYLSRIFENIYFCRFTEICFLFKAYSYIGFMWSYSFNRLWYEFDADELSLN